MTFRHAPFNGPFFDPYRVGFGLYLESALNWRPRTIAGVSWNGREREALFFNPDGLALPLEPHPWELPALLERHAVRREFATIHGAGQFAMKPARRNAMSPAVLNEWMTYWLVDDAARYANSPSVWGAYVESDLAAERQCIEACHTLSESLQRRNPNLAVGDLGESILDGLAARRDHLQAEHERQCAEDRRISAWLRGEPMHLPLLAQLATSHT
jgi:hypothetical protein